MKKEIAVFLSIVFTLAISSILLASPNYLPVAPLYPDASPTPTWHSYPTPLPAAPYPTQVPYNPYPTQLPIPTQVPYLPYPTQVPYTAYNPYPTQIPYTAYNPYPTAVPYNPYPTQLPHLTQIPYNPYPTQVPYAAYNAYNAYNPYPTQVPYTAYNAYPTQVPYSAYPAYNAYPTQVPYNPYPTQVPYAAYPTQVPYTAYNAYPTQAPYLTAMGVNGNGVTASASVSAPGMGVTVHSTFPMNSVSIAVTTIGGSGAVTFVVYGCVNKVFSQLVSIGSIGITGAAAVSCMTFPFTGMDFGVSIINIAASTTVTGYLSGFYGLSTSGATMPVSLNAPVTNTFNGVAQPVTFAITPSVVSIPYYVPVGPVTMTTAVLSPTKVTGVVPFSLFFESFKSLAGAITLQVYGYPIDPTMAGVAVGAPVTLAALGTAQLSQSVTYISMGVSVSGLGSGASLVWNGGGK